MSALPVVLAFGLGLIFGALGLTGLVILRTPTSSPPAPVPVPAPVPQTVDASRRTHVQIGAVIVGADAARPEVVQAARRALGELT